MIMKERQYPVKAKKLEALIRRLEANHPKAALIEQEYAKILAGYRGEQSLNYFLSFLPQEQYFIFHDLRLPSLQNEYFFQMDILLLSQQFFLIIEVKNIAGSVTYDPSNQQLIQFHQDKETVYRDPFLQVQRQKQQLYRWIEKANIATPPPICTLVILSNSQTLIKENASSKNLKLIRPDRLINKISEFEKIYKHELVSQKDLKKLGRQFLKVHSDEEYNVMQKFDLSADDLTPGVHCPKCFHLPMNRKRYTWFCPQCKYENNDVYLPSLNDYYYLFGNTINNPQLRFFLKIPSRHSARRIFINLNLPHTGNTKAATYTLPFD
ncbi:NERD domain-containing protein [Bacillus sp. AGMB 02131]|uniref:NERD domain-containing protein n=1 Tax=Peribacillus faecalis TaxID=2772559 RepID=A0A927HD00_9BACI|nr:nuclease-related domain-containing protein [Peribacillus faecalis]MBD3110167.1 NERD domain-containing protein [Peribacillus faecalis]